MIFKVVSYSGFFQMEKMLETIAAIKNNKLRAKEDSVQNTRVKKWLQKVISQLLILTTAFG